MADNTSTTKFKADISELKSAMQQAARQVKLANSEFKAATAGMDDWTDSADGLSAKIKQLNTTLNAQKSQLSSLEKQYKLVSEEQGENSKGAEELKVKINNQKAAIANTEKQLDNYENELKDCENGTGRFADELDEVDDAARSAGDGFTVMKGILSSLIADVVQWGISELKDLAGEIVEVGSSFEKSMSNVQALSGATEEELQLLSDTAKEFGANTQFSATEAADALSYMALAGWDAQTSCDALGGVLDLAASSGMDLASASDMVTDYLSAFSMSAEESTYLADLLSYAQSNANTTAEQLGEAFGNTAANMNAAGQDIETTTALLSSMANQGLKGSEAGTALTAVMRDISQKMKTLASDANTAELAEEGLVSITGDLNDVLGKNYIEIGNTLIPVSDLEGNYRDLTDILKDVESATDGLGEAEKSTALQSTFTSKSIKGVNLVLNDGVDNAAAFEEELRNCGGTAAETAKIMNDNLSGDITALNSKLEGIKITIYESMAPALRDAVAEISNVLDTVNWEEKGKQIGEITVKAVNFFSKIIENADGVKSILAAVGTSLGTAFVVSKVMTFASSIVSLWKTFQTLKTVTEAATTSQLLLNAAQAATPVGLVTAAVAGLAAGLIYLASKSKEAKEATETLTEYEQKEIDKVYELKQAYEDMSTTRDENVKNIGTEYEYYQTLADELDSLVDANGNVKAGYEDRVNFILTTLNEAVGTEMELVDGVIQNYQEEKQAIEDLIETKKAQAILSANEDLYTQAIQNQNDALQAYMSSQGIYKQNVAELSDLESKYNKIKDMTATEYANANNLIVSETTAAEMLADEQRTLTDKINGTKGALVESKTAMLQAEKTYTDYQTTIKNYEGLSAAIISGDATKIKTALNDLQYNFKTTETANRDSLEQQVKDYEENLTSLEQAIKNGTPGVTQEMVDQAKSMVNAAKEELDKLPSEAEESANTGASRYATTLGSDANKKKVASNANVLRDSANQGLKPNGDEQTAGDNLTLGYLGGMKLSISSVNTTARSISSGAVDELNKGQESNSPSEATKRSGEYFGQGFINGMNNKTNSIWTTAWNLAKTALNALKQGQQEGSPSKLTFQSGKYFTEGYINGIASMQTSLVNTVKSLVTSAIQTANNMSGYNFSDVGISVADSLANTLANKTNYMINKLTYQNEKKIAEFDTEISRLEKEQDKKIAKKEKERAKASAKIQKASDTKIAKYEKQKNTAQTDAEKTALDKKIAAEKENVKKRIAASDKVFDKEKTNIENKYKKLIATQEKYKTAYQDASTEFISEFSDAINEYSSKAQDLINSTINDVADKYQTKYDELIQKQDTLIGKLKSAGNLFNISGAGVMTVNDIKEQTRQITDYTNKLQKIKEKVSSELFDQIASYDMKEGSAFMDRLLAMSASDLDAYNKAYAEKMQAAEKAGENIYSSDIKKVGEEYKKELNKALSGLPKQLEELGYQTMQGFVNGLTQNTDYMSKEVKTFIASMVDNFKKELKIKSPSHVMMEIGDYTGEGFVNGLKSTINSVKKTAGNIAQAAAMPLEDLSTNLNGIRSTVNGQNAQGPSINNVTNNYNLVQNNTSPKSLSALETYQARRQQIALMKAFT